VKISADCVEFIKTHEGLRLKAYVCPAGVLTIGYGHTKTVTPGMIIARAEADQLFLRDVAEFETGVMQACGTQLQHRFDALVSFAFNVGLAALRRSTLIKHVRDENYKAAADQFLRWNKVKGRPNAGLTKRRRQERLMFLGLKY
jgi:lysozyme